MITQGLLKKLLILFGVSGTALASTYALVQAQISPGDEIWSGSKYNFGIEWAASDIPLIRALCQDEVRELQYTYAFAGKTYKGSLLPVGTDTPPNLDCSSGNAVLEVNYRETAGDPANPKSICVGQALLVLETSGQGQFRWNTTGPQEPGNWCDLTNQNDRIQVLRRLRNP